jgi:putative ABC transport system permease protein
VRARLAELAREAAASLRESRHRGGAALLGLAVGIGAVVALTSVAAMARAHALAGLRELGVDVLAVSVAGGEGSRSGRLQPGDAASLVANAPSLRAATPLLLTRAELRLGAAGRPVAVIGVAPELAGIVTLDLAAGRFLSPLDRGAGFCVLGAHLGARVRALRSNGPVGRTVDLGGRTLTVAGVLAPVGESAALPFRLDDSVLVPLAVAARLAGRGDADLILAGITPGWEGDEPADQIRRLFALTRPSLQVEVASPDAARAQVARQSRLLTVLLAAFGSIAMVLGAAGVMNVMVLAVGHRRREIGVRRSLGASRRDIRVQFLLEAVALAAVGGLAGVALGSVAAAAVAAFSGWPFVVAWWGMLLAVAVSAVVGVAAGVFPAHLAARIEPVNALRE